MTSLAHGSAGILLERAALAPEVKWFYESENTLPNWQLDGKCTISADRNALLETNLEALLLRKIKIQVDPEGPSGRRAYGCDLFAHRFDYVADSQQSPRLAFLKRFDDAHCHRYAEVGADERFFELVPVNWFAGELLGE